MKPMRPMSEDEPVPILLVEDNRGDVRLVKEALRECPVRTFLSVASDGEQALAFLHRRAPFGEAPRPRLILLDLNLPRKDGREVLLDIKHDPGLKTIPIVVLTTSKADDDILSSYENHANCYMTKPVSLDEFIRAIRVIMEFWLRTVRLPPAKKALP